MLPSYHPHSGSYEHTLSFTASHQVCAILTLTAHRSLLTTHLSPYPGKIPAPPKEGSTGWVTPAMLSLWALFGK